MAPSLDSTVARITISALLIFSIFSFVIITQNQNNKQESILNNTLINLTFNNLYGNLSGSQSQSQASFNNFGNITPSEQLGQLEVTAVISPTRIFSTISLGLWNIFIQLPIKVLGISPIVASIISSLIILVIIIGIWAIWKGVISLR